MREKCSLMYVGLLRGLESLKIHHRNVNPESIVYSIRFTGVNT